MFREERLNRRIGYFELRGICHIVSHTVDTEIFDVGPCRFHLFYKIFCQRRTDNIIITALDQEQRRLVGRNIPDRPPRCCGTEVASASISLSLVNSINIGLSQSSVLGGVGLFVRPAMLQKALQSFYNPSLRMIGSLWST